jgi:hypothetical protein
MIERLLEAGAERARPRPGGDARGAAIFGDRITISSELRRAAGRRRAADRHRVERVQASGLRAHPRPSAHPVVFDGRNIYDREEMARMGFRYYSVGRPPVRGDLMGRMLITGGAGFIGSHLADRLLAEGHEVIAIDNLCHRPRPRNIAT